MPSRTPLLPRQPGGADTVFTWPAEPPAGWSPKGGSASGGGDGGAQPATGALDTKPVVSAAGGKVDKRAPAVTGTTRPRAPAAACRFYHEAPNHSDSTVKALIDTGLVANAGRPSGFSCAACSHANPSGAHFRRNTKTSPSVPLPPYCHVEMDLWGPMDVGDRNGFHYIWAPSAGPRARFTFSR